MELVLEPNGDYYVIDQKTTTMTSGIGSDILTIVTAFLSSRNTFNYTEDNFPQYYVEEKFVYDSKGTLDGAIIATFSSLEDLQTNYPELLI